MLAVLLSVLLGGCATYDGDGRSYGGYGNKECQAIAMDPWAGPDKMPSTCQRLNRPR
jgi:hypothetical protein